jgi:hypothetical protein
LFLNLLPLAAVIRASLVTLGFWQKRAGLSLGSELIQAPV